MTSANLKQAFADRLARLRAGHGRAIGRPTLSQKEFAEALKLEAETYRTYERAEREPSLGTLCQLRIITGASLDMLIAGQPPGDTRIFGTGNTFAERLGWVRRLREPDEALAAKALGTSETLLAAYEAGDLDPPLDFVREFSNRFRVSSAFLVDGDRSRLPEDLRAQWTEEHPLPQKPGRVRTTGRRRTG